MILIVEVAVLGSPSLIVPTVSVDVIAEQHLRKKTRDFRAQKLCGSGGDRPGLPVPNSPHGLCGRKATSEEDLMPTEEWSLH